jgi:hypothetical protein
MTNEELEEMFDKPVSVYTRKQAIEDGMLGDVTKEAKEIGFKFPVAVSSAVADFLTIEKINVNQLLKELLINIQLTKKPGAIINFTFKKRKMYSVVGPGDAAEPVITIMFIGED